MNRDIKLYIFQFFLFSIIGWIYEVVLGFIYGHGFVNRGFLFGSYLPVYGFGALILIVMLNGVMKNPKHVKNIPVTPIAVFFLIVLITTVLEYMTGSLLELIFHQRWWDYSADFLNINGLVCPRTSFRFGVGGMLFLYVLDPLFVKMFNKISLKYRTYVSISIIGVILADTFHAVIQYL